MQADVTANARGDPRVAPTHFLQDWPLVPILALAAALRMGWPGLTEFKYDEARLSGLVLDWVRGGPFPLTGMANSAGLNHPPWGVYWLALPYALWANPIGATLFVGALNVLAVAGCYWLARRWYGRMAAWTGSLLFAAAPWAVLYSRKLWTNDLLPPFVLLCVAAGYLGLVEGRPRWLAVLPVAVALTVGLHPTGAALAVWAVAALVVFRQRVRRRPLLAGLALAAACSLPYGLYLGAVLLKYAGRAAAPGNGMSAWSLDATALRLAWLMTTGSEIHSLAGPQAYRDFLASMPPYEAVFAVAGLLAVLAVAWLLQRTLRLWREGADPRAYAPSALLLLWLALPIAQATYHSLPVYTHYLIVLFPAAFIAVGAFVARVHARWPRAGQALAASVVIIAVTQAAVFGALLAFVAGRATPGGFGGTLQYWLAAADAVRAAPVCDVRVLGNGTNPAYDEIPAIFHALLPGDARVQFVDAREPQWPANSALVVVPPAGTWRPPGFDASDVAATVDTIALRPGEGAIVLARYPRDLPAGVVTETVAFANGTRLLARAAQGTAAPGQTLRVYLQWALGGAPDEELHIFNHVLDAGGAMAGQGDGPLCAGGTWREGARVWTWFDVTLDPAAPPGPYRLRTGLYTYPDVRNVPLADGSGDAVVWEPGR
jgi:4-amino-4-deoxy-L-arabinose transferase-like glycosyltransferase